MIYTGYRQKKHKSGHIKPLSVGHTLQPPIDNCLCVLCQLETAAASSVTGPAAAGSYTHCSIPSTNYYKRYSAAEVIFKYRFH